MSTKWQKARDAFDLKSTWIRALHSSACRGCDPHFEPATTSKSIADDVCEDSSGLTNARFKSLVRLARRGLGSPPADHVILAGGLALIMVLTIMLATCALRCWHVGQRRTEIKTCSPSNPTHIAFPQHVPCWHLGIRSWRKAHRDLRALPRAACCLATPDASISAMAGVQR